MNCRKTYVRSSSLGLSANNTCPRHPGNQPNRERQCRNRFCRNAYVTGHHDPRLDDYRKAHPAAYGFTGFMLVTDPAPPNHGFQYFGCTSNAEPARRGRNSSVG